MNFVSKVTKCIGTCTVNASNKMDFYKMCNSKFRFSTKARHLRKGFVVSLLHFFVLVTCTSVKLKEFGGFAVIGK